MDARRGLSRGRVIAIAVLIAWFVAVLWWAFQPFNDSVPTGSVNNQQTTQVVRCDAPLSANAGPTGSLPSLPPDRAYEREPCAQAHSQYRALFWADTVLVVIVLALLVGVRRQARQSPEAVNSPNSYATPVP